ncbi:MULTISPECIES: DUF3325 family protein [unclassified Pseudomonas]|uniref:DUF3325 family protein n=1 Tax=unclassified Pseudomonas TaxID=196821 RepID=UPI000D854814|nr:MULTISPECIES: DUF3325 family protein [unclassified Pseudomonas]PYG78402.1 uncharacterized protein DUF3325 [Pseudomonas sp. RV120224-01c]PYG82657.1 uncharacterized protein DUF3325 [Pseudomonas sp. RV120224-01b]
MPEWLTSGVVLGLQTLGLALLALSQAGHWQRVMPPRALPGIRALRLSALLASSLAWLVGHAGLGVAMGTLFWVLAQVPCGLGVSLMLCWRKAWLRRLGRCFCR